jgi:hypothetical protein
VTTRLDTYLQHERERVGGKAKSVTHEQLVKAGKIWLLNTKRCRVVATELVTGVQEQPDIIGWQNFKSFMIECKVSRSDFFADAKKSHRLPKCGMGEMRWYLTPRGLVKPEEVPDGWGLIEHRHSNHIKRYYIKELVKPLKREKYADGPGQVEERAMLVAIAWRALEAQKLTRPLAIGGEDAEEDRHNPEHPDQQSASEASEEA